MKWVLLSTIAMRKPASFYFTHHYSPTVFLLEKQLSQFGIIQAGNAASADITDTNIYFGQGVLDNLEQKHRLHELLHASSKAIMPESYVIDDDNWSTVLNALTTRYYLDRDGQQVSARDDIVWILKPSLLNNGAHIKLFNHISALWDHYTIGLRMGGPHVLQRYIQYPYCIQGAKHTIRLFCIVTNYAGIFCYEHGYMNISPCTYAPNDWQNLSRHLTNEHLTDATGTVRQIASHHFPFFKTFQPRCLTIMRHVFDALDKTQPHWRKPTKHKICEILGFDFLIDAQGQVWLLEINQAPCFPKNKAHPLTTELYEKFWYQLVSQFFLPIIHNNACNVHKSFIMIRGPWRFWHKYGL